jgi:hypothetical protein
MHRAKNFSSHLTSLHQFGRPGRPGQIVGMLFALGAHHHPDGALALRVQDRSGGRPSTLSQTTPTSGRGRPRDDPSQRSSLGGLWEPPGLGDPSKTTQVADPPLCPRQLSSPGEGPGGTETSREISFG